MTNIAIENGHRNRGFSHKTWWFSIAMLVYQRVGQVGWSSKFLGHDPWSMMAHQIFRTYPLVNIQKTIGNHHFQWENPLSMAIFNSYVKLPEGKLDCYEIGIYGEIQRWVRSPTVAPPLENGTFVDSKTTAWWFGTLILHILPYWKQSSPLTISYFSGGFSVCHQPAILCQCCFQIEGMSSGSNPVRFPSQNPMEDSLWLIDTSG